jgi:hypothetical protein
MVTDEMVTRALQQYRASAHEDDGVVSFDERAAIRAALSAALPVQAEPVAVATPTEFNQIGMTLAFLCSVIKSGESWTDTCQQEYDHAQACLSQLRSALASPAPSPSEDDLIAAREAAAQVLSKSAAAIHCREGRLDDLNEVQSALIAIRAERKERDEARLFRDDWREVASEQSALALLKAKDPTP